MRVGVFLLMALLLFTGSLSHSHSHERSGISGYKCMHDKLIKDEQKKGNDVHKKAVASGDMFKRSIKDSKWTNLRIVFRTDYVLNDVLQRTCYSKGQAYRVGSPASTNVACTATITTDCWGVCDSVVSDNHLNELNNLIPQIQDTFNNMLLTRSFNGKITLPSGNCGANGGVPYPSDLKTYGLNSTVGDLVIFLTLRPSTDVGVLGWGLACLYESTYGRPIVGQFNADPETFFAASTGQQIGIMIHEITHVLGFSETRFTSMIDAFGNQRANSVLSGVRSYTDSQGNVDTKTIFYLNTPTLINTARTYFNCNTNDSLPYGVELEEYGGDGTAGSHFEKRVYNNELMTGNVGWFNPSLSFSISPFILSFFNDSGWYQSNATFTHPRSETMLWGKNQGCQFLANRCEDWDPQNRNGYFCKSSPSEGGSVCTFNQRSKGFCGTQTFNQNMGYYEHIPSSPTTGGLDPQLDFCPIIKKYSNGDCGHEQLQSNMLSGEYWGVSGACFDSNLVPSGSNTIQQDARCFKFDCSNNYLRINAAGTWVDCPEDQSYRRTLLQGSFKGYIDCPVDGYDILCKSNQAVVIDGQADNSESCSNLFGWFCTNSSNQTRSAEYAVLAIIVTWLFSFVFI